MSDMNVEGGNEAQQNLRRQLRRIRRERDLALDDVKRLSDAQDREIETLTALNKSQAERIDVILRENQELAGRVKGLNEMVAKLESRIDQARED
jgi:hypothetical protein